MKKLECEQLKILILSMFSRTRKIGHIEPHLLVNAKVGNISIHVLWRD